MHTSNAGAGWARIAAIFCLLALLISACFLLGSCGDNKTPEKPDTGDVTPKPDDTEKPDPEPDDTDKPDPKPEEPKQEFTLVFMIEGEVYKTFKVKEGDTFTDIPDLPEFPGYIGSWENYSFENIKDNMTIYAVYNPATYTLTFDYGDAAEGTETTGTETTYGSSIGTLPTPKKEGYVFDGWYIGEKKIDRYTRWEYTENKTATAHFVDYYSEGLTYAQYSGSELWVSGIGTCTDTDIIVPATYQGNPVVGIAYSAFKDNTQITSVCFGENVYKIERFAFENCTSLRSVTFKHTAGLPEDYTPNYNDYGYNAFNGCTAFEELTIPTYILALLVNNTRGLQTVKHLTTTAGDTFPSLLDYDTLETVVINEGVRTMGYATFRCNNNYAESHLTSVTLPESLTEIPEGAFGKCRALTSVKIGKNVTSIGPGAFAYTSKNLSIELSPENTSFTYKDGCLIEKASGTLIALKGDYVLPTDGSLKVITSASFFGFDLTEILIPASVTTIEAYAFEGCGNLKKFIVEDGSLLTVIGDYAFEGTPEIAKVPLAVVSSFTRAKELTVIGSGAFDTEFSGYGVCIERLILGDGITSVGERVLVGNKTIQYVKLGSGITSIGKEAFCNSSLAEIDLSEGLLTIGESAFEQCYSLEEITIPSSVTSIGEDAFFINQNYGTPALSRVNVSDVEKWASISFANDYANPLFIGHRLYKDGREVTTIAFTTLTKIADYAFDGCRSLTSVSFEPTVQEIGKYAFTGCINLRAADFMRKEGETKPLVIDEAAFWYCRALPGITRAVNLTKVGAKAFAYCYSMVEFTIPASVTEFSSDAFYNNPNMKEVTNLSSAVDGSVFGDRLLAEGAESKIVRKDHTIFYNQNGTYYLIGTDAGGQLADYYTLPSDINGNPYIVGSYAFIGTAFKYITVPSTAQITRLNNYAFAQSGIWSLSVYLELDSYSSYLCYACTDLQEVTFTGGIVADHAFDSCTSLTTLNLGNVTWIRRSAFAGCTSLAEVTLPSTLGSFGNDGDQFENCTALTKVVVSEGITSLPSDIFYGCTNLAEVVLPSTITSIGYSAFSGAGRATTGLHIYFAGTEDAWNAVSGLDNAGLPENVTYHFESAGPEKTEE